MKKIVKIVLAAFIVFVLSLPAIGKAASVGSADTQGGMGKFSLGIEYDRLDKRDMKYEKGSQTTTIGSTTTSGDYVDPGDSIKDMELSANRVFLKGVMGIHSNVDLFLKVGVADAKLKYKYTSPGSPDEKDEFNGDNHFAWGVGAKAKIFETSGGLRFMADAQYLYYEADGGYKVDGKDLAQYLRDAGASSASYESSTEVQEWHAAMYVNQTFGIFSPYAGVKYSDLRIENDTYARANNWSTMIKAKVKADKNIGVFLGTGIDVIPNQLSVNIEGRFLDETAGAIGATYKF